MRPRYTVAEVKRWLGVFLRRFFQVSQYKRSAISNAPKVGSGGSLSPRGDWRALPPAEAIRLSQHAEAVGADGVLVVPITYWRLTDQELYGHYEAIARAVKFPVGIYNNPGTTGVDIKPAVVARIATIDNVGFVKESSGDMSRISAIRQLTGYQIAVMNGNDACTPEAIAAGVDGWFAGSANIMPKQCVELFR